MAVAQRISAFTVMALMVSGCTTDTGTGWRTSLYRDHFLAGKIWVPADNRYTTTDEVYAAAGEADYLLIGEKHDNADHHRLQAELVAEIAGSGRKGAVVFEMLTESQQQALDDHLSAHPRDAAGIGPAVGWEKSGWPAWDIYEPIAEQALNNGMALIAGGIDKETIRKIARAGPDALGDGRTSELMLDQPVSEEIRAEMREVILESHCQQLPEQMLDPMVLVTLTKDAVMANKMRSSRADPAQDVSVLIAGGGHVRKDWGVPMHLARMDPDSRIVTIAMMEVEQDIVDPADYGNGTGGGNPFDFVWFTPRVDEEDPCEVFAEQLRRMREKQQKKDGSGPD